MKRVKAAYLEQILHFMPKEDIEKEEARALLDKEIAKYKHSLDGKLYRIYKEEELESALSNCGLKVINKFDGYSNNKVQANSERIVYVVKKI